MKPFRTLTDAALTYEDEDEAVRFYNLTTEGKEKRTAPCLKTVRFHTTPTAG